MLWIYWKKKKKKKKKFVIGDLVSNLSLLLLPEVVEFLTIVWKSAYTVEKVNSGSSILDIRMFFHFHYIDANL